jgi:chitin disaccharide deacetylase
MLIINADDWGMDAITTDKIMECFTEERITTTTAMVFMHDSERAAALALEHNLEVGLHLNFTRPFDAKNATGKLRDAQGRLVRFFAGNRYNRMLYHPFIVKDVRDCFNAQIAEFVRLYHSEPTHIDGHHHIHLCTNLLLSRAIPSRYKIRKGVSFEPGQRSLINRMYRNIVNEIVERKHPVVDRFFILDEVLMRSGIHDITSLANRCDVELCVHPGTPEDFRYLMGGYYHGALSTAKIGRYSEL